MISVVAPEVPAESVGTSRSSELAYPFCTLLWAGEEAQRRAQIISDSRGCPSRGDINLERITPMEKDGAFPESARFLSPRERGIVGGPAGAAGRRGEEPKGSRNDFPTDGVELRCFLVVSNYARSLAFYRDVLGARVLRELPGTLCELRFAGSQILLSAPFGSRPDNPAATDPPPPDRKSVISELSSQVPDCLAAYEVLRSRGAEFLTPPFEWSNETRAFFHDPDGHLLEIREVREAERRSE
jgi:catechol 2,3-dioxygenase-like lactoylglutathione lyase family enzyme